MRTPTSSKYWTEFITRCDSLLKAGKISEVRGKLERLPLKTVPRPKMALLAQICTRAGLFGRGLRLLVGIFHPKFREQSRVTNLERTAYATLLIKVGSIEEGLRIIESISETDPHADLCRAYAHQSRWDYASAIPLLRSYLARSPADTYEAGVIKVNLLASLIANEENDEAQILLGELVEQSRRERWTLLYKNLQHLACQLAANNRDLHEAKRALIASRPHYKDDSLWDFLISKWNAFIDLKVQPDHPGFREQVQLVRNRAIALGHWESVRECDRAMAFAARDHELLTKIFFGTPYPAYRAKLLREAAGWFTLAPKSYVLGSGSRILDLHSGICQGDSSLSLKPGRVLHKSVQTLFSDIYRPIFLGNFHEQVYLGQHFNPESSYNRIGTAIHRVRTWITAHHLPLEIIGHGGFVSIRMPEKMDNFAVRYSEPVPGDPHVERVPNLVRARRNFGPAQFTAGDLAGFLRKSKSYARRLLAEGVASGALTRTGSARYTYYKFE